MTPIVLTFYGHAALNLEVNGTNLLVDPFLADNPAATVSPVEVEADYILVSHGHEDHIGDAVDIAQRTGATLISNYEITNWFIGQGIEKVHPQHLGGGYHHPFGYLKLTLATHGSGLPDGSCGGTPCGFLLAAFGKNIYLACDTGLFGDMSLIGEVGIGLAVLPIGDNFTMGPADALRAIKLIHPAQVVPIHYNTWDLISQDPTAWKNDVEASTDTLVHVLKPNQSITV